MLTRYFFIISLAVICICCPFRSLAQNGIKRVTVAEYIEKYKALAIEEMKFYNIPASIKLAQALVESDAGNSQLSRESNNHFGIKCHKGWTGETYYYDDDEKNECFRKYPGIEDSYRDHSNFLTSRPRYAPLFELEITDYRGWARTLKACGYATNPQYAEILIRKIEENQLDRFDRPMEELAQKEEQSGQTGLEREPKWPDPGNFRQFSVTPTGTVVYLNNGLKFIYAEDGDTPESIAAQFRIYPFQIRKYNELAKNEKLHPGQMVYLQRKAKRSEVYYHYLQPGETMYTVSQMYGIRLKWLYRKNLMAQGTQPEAGQKLWLRENRK